MVKTTLRFGWILLCLVLALVCRCWNVRDVFLEGHIYYVDGDCYARMTRARMIVEHPGSIIRHHDFENWPQGITTHTTAPLDYLIAFLKVIFDGLFALIDPHHTSLLHDQTLDIAGALVSPLLGLAGAIFLAWWLEKFRVRFGSMALLIYAISPINVHGTLLGRPDHQSLLMTLITVAIGAELALAHRGDSALSTTAQKGWGIVSGLAWSLSLWVSLYEPTILLVVTLGLWLAFDRRALLSRNRLPGAIAFAVVLLLYLLLEGWSVPLPDADVRKYFPNWEQTIGELKHLYPTLLFGWVGWTVVATPVLLFLAWKKDRRALPLLILVLIVLVLTVWQARWGYFLAVVFAWAIPWQMQPLRWSWVAWPVFIACLWPILQEWDARLYPEDDVQDRQAMQRLEVVNLRGLATQAIGGAQGGPFLAPWWLSPSVAYWSRQNGVAGTSHESLPGIVDTARFYLSTDFGPAADILRKRSVHWVLATDPRHEVENSSTILGEPAAKNTVAATLYDHPEDVPDFLREWSGPAAQLQGDLAGRTTQLASFRFFRLYEVIDANLPP